MEQLNKEIQRPLDVTQIFEIAKKSCNIIPYSDMFQISSIDELFSDNPLYSIQSEYPKDDNSCIILYLTSKNFGHWCILNKIEDDDKIIYGFLDSYGELLDDQLNHVSEDFKQVSNQEDNYLTTLLYEAIKNVPSNKLSVHYNDTQMQMLNDKISTCGRYVALFLKYNYMTVEDYVKTLTEAAEDYNIPIDMLVTMLTV